MYVQHGSYDKFVRRWVDADKSRVAGEPIGSSTQQGARLIRLSLKRYRDTQSVEGGDCLLAVRKRHGDNPWSVQLFGCSDVTDDAVVAREEIFGPVVPTLKFKTIDEVTKRANDCMYGIGAGVVTKDASNAIRSLIDKVQTQFM